MPATDSPIGSIIAYAGEITREWEDANGWLRCDGRPLDRTQPDNADLYNAIGFAWGGDNDTQFNVPDLQGFFLRGVDPVRRPPSRDTRVPFPADPEREQRFEIRFGGNKGNKVGSAQLYATALPTHSFKTQTAGQHSHNMNFETTATRDVDSQANTVAYPALVAPLPVTEAAGDHAHEIVAGGDSESRPLNAYVHWIIRARVIPPPPPPGP
jgi:microcystin-dependent protein